MATSRTLDFLDQFRPSMGRDAAIAEYKRMVHALRDTCYAIHHPGDTQRAKEALETAQALLALTRDLA